MKGKGKVSYVCKKQYDRLFKPDVKPFVEGQLTLCDRDRILKVYGEIPDRCKNQECIKIEIRKI